MRDAGRSASLGEAAIDARHERGGEIVRAAAATALRYFAARDTLLIESKGAQDWVSEADREVEREIRAALADAFPEDCILGEEHAATPGTSGFTWVIDPIDGTTNFLNGLPGWCVVLAGVNAGETVVAHLCDPVADESFAARRGAGATLDGRPLRASSAASLANGTLGVGHSARVPAAGTLALLGSLLSAGGLFYRSGSGALDLAKVAAGRLIGYCEAHMNAWDCLAALLLIEEAGGRVRPFDMPTMLAHGDRVVAATPGVFDALASMTDAAFGDGSVSS